MNFISLNILEQPDEIITATAVLFLPHHHHNNYEQKKGRKRNKETKTYYLFRLETMLIYANDTETKIGRCTISV